MSSKTIRIHARDNVATALETLSAGLTVELNDDPAPIRVTLLEDVAFGHKFAVREIDAGGDVVKYGACIGRASRTIRAGEHVHVHNTESNRGRGDLPGAAATVGPCGGTR